LVGTQFTHWENRILSLRNDPFASERKNSPSERNFSASEKMERPRCQMATAAPETAKTA
jgi:hypothetical protein